MKADFRAMMRDARGNIAMMFGLLLFAIFGAAGIAVDIARSNLIRTDIHEATDAAVLAAARYRATHPNASDDELSAMAQKVFDNEIVDRSAVDIKSFKLIFDKKTDTFVADVEGTADTLIMGVVGDRYVDIGAHAEVRLGKPPLLEVVLALDVTGSMKKNGRMAGLKKAAKNLVDTLFDAKDAKVRIGVVPFAQYVNVGTANASAGWLDNPGAGWSGCVGSRAYPLDVGEEDYFFNKAPGVVTANCPAEVTPLTDDRSALKKKVDDFTPNGMTYIPAGLLWGWNLLTPSEPFADAISFSALESENGTKALVLMTDGYNTRAPSYPLHDSPDTALANDRTKEICRSIKNDTITVYTIAFEITDKTIKNILEGCATSPGHYFDAENSDQLSDAFEAIALGLRSISLSK